MGGFRLLDLVRGNYRSISMVRFLAAVRPARSLRRYVSPWNSGFLTQSLQEKLLETYPDC